MILSEIRQLEVRGLGHGFPGTPLLFENLTFTALPGEVIGICGPSGSGKSTLMSIIAAWEEPREGKVSRPGITTTNWVFQNPHGVARRTAIDHVVFPLLAQGLSRDEAHAQAISIMDVFGLGKVADRPFHELSGGEAQRLMLARAVTRAPDLLLIDEPTAQLDARTSETVNSTIGSIAINGSIVLVATHDAGTRDACTRVIQLDDYAPTRAEDTP